MFSRSLVAIDIGSSSIKVVEMSGRGQRRLRSIGLQVLPLGTVMDGMIQNPEVVKDVLRELLGKLKIRPRGRRAAIAISGSSVLVKRVTVTGKGQDLTEQVYYEAEQQLQADMAEIYFDYSKVGPDAGGEGGQSVIMVGAKRDLVEQYVSILRGIGMRAAVIECGIFSTANMFEYNYGAVSGLIAVVNVGAAMTQVSLIFQGEFVFTRDIPIGGEEYSRRIMERIGCDHENAESLKVAASQGDANVPQELAPLLGEVNEQLVSDVQLTLDHFYQTAAGLGGLTGIFLTGGGARVLGLDAALAATLQVPVQIVNPFQRVDVDPKKFQMDYILMQGHLYGVAVGLGLRSAGD